jgi:osmotically-inducible protein OsmY
MKPAFSLIAVLLFPLLLSHCAAIIVGGAALTGAAVLHDRRTPTIVLDDQNIGIHAYKIIAELKADDKDIRIIPFIYNQNLLVIGQVPQPYIRHTIINRLNLIPKVGRVFDELAIGPPIPPAVRRYDAWITSRIKSKLLLDRHIDASQVKVLTEDGIVYMMGVVHPSEKAAALHIARTTEGVHKVIPYFKTL